MLFRTKNRKNKRYIFDVILPQVIADKEYDIIYDKYNDMSLPELKSLYIKLGDNLPKTKTKDNIYY